MLRKVTIALDQDSYGELHDLADRMGFTPEMAAAYAVRLVNACVREGLIEDIPARAWPQEARLLAGTGAKVLAFSGRGKR